MELYTKVNRNLDLINSALKNASQKYHHLLYPELTATVNNSGLNLICVDSNYAVDDGSIIDFSFYYHPIKVIVLNYQTINNKRLEPLHGKDFKLAYNLILIHEIGHFLAYNHNDFTENGAWRNGLNLAEYLNLFTPQLTQLFKNYFIA